MGDQDLIKPLHGLRGIAAMMVVLHHLAPFEYRGVIGVTLFFVLSGFLMGRLYLVKAFSACNLWRYGTARFARVYPLFALVILAAAASGLWLDAPVFGLEWWQVDQHLLLMGGNPTVWTIAVEFQFYALFALVWLAQSRGLVSWPVLLIAYAVLAIGPFISYEFPRDRLNPALYMHIFAVGLLVSAVSQRPSQRIQTLAAFVLPVALLVFIGWGLTQAKAYQSPFVVLSAAALVYCSVVAVSSPVARALSVRPMVWLGEISFGVYLLHRFAEAIVQHALGTKEDSWLSMGLGIAGTLALSTLVFKVYEDPLRLFIRRAAARIEARVTRKSHTGSAP